MEVLARTVETSGRPVAFVRCYEVFDRCPVMDMYAVPEPTGNAVSRDYCDVCLYNSVRMLSRYDLPAVALQPWHEAVSGTLDAAMQDVGTPSPDFTYDGVPFGTLVLHDLTLVHKLADVDRVPESLHAAWRQRVRSCLLTYLIVSAMCETGRIESLVVFNDSASQVSARLAAQRQGVRCRSVGYATHRNADHRRLVITESVAHQAHIEHAGRWPEWRDLSIAPAAIEEVAEDVIRHFTHRGGASHIYSHGLTTDPDQLRGHLQLSGHRKVIVAFTSSLDEDNAARAYRRVLGIDGHEVERSTFPDQIEWLRTLASFASSSDDVELVIRVHPREDANERDGVSSAHLRLLRAEFGTAPANVRIVWPSDRTSSYDLARLADVVAVSWSSIGLELARAGLPVLATAVGAVHFLPRGDAVAWEPSPDRYVIRLREMIDAPTSFDTTLLAYRWYAMRALGIAIDISDVVPSPDLRGLPRWHKPAEAPVLTGVLTGDVHPETVNLATLRSQQSPSLALAERQALQGQLGRLLEVVVTGKDPGSGGRLRLVDGPPSTASSSDATRDGSRTGALREVAVVGDILWFRTDNGWRSIRSPMATRLAVLATSGATVSEN